MNIGRAVKLCRTQRGLTQGELARKASISLSYLSLIERNRRDPTLSTVQALAAALEVPSSILLFLAAEKEELAHLDDELRSKLSAAALALMHG